MLPTHKQQVVDLLKSLETKDPAPFAYVNPVALIAIWRSVSEISGAIAE
jgi:hypothetical protein